MFKRKMFLIVIGLLLIVGLAGVGVQAKSGGTVSSDDPWLLKPVLPYLLLTSDARLEGEAQTLFKVLNLSVGEEKSLQQIAVEEQQQVQAPYQESQVIVQDETRSTTDKQEAVLKHNEGVSGALASTDQAVRQLLGSRYTTFREWVRKWWSEEKTAITNLKQPQVVPDSGYGVCYMFATQYYGYTNYEVALPDKYIKFAKPWLLTLASDTWRTVTSPYTTTTCPR
jgi:hypothetical protein